MEVSAPTLKFARRRQQVMTLTEHNSLRWTSATGPATKPRRLCPEMGQGSRPSQSATLRRPSWFSFLMDWRRRDQERRFLSSASLDSNKPQGKPPQPGEAEAVFCSLPARGERGKGSA